MEKVLRLYRVVLNARKGVNGEVKTETLIETYICNDDNCEIKKGQLKQLARSYPCDISEDKIVFYVLEETCEDKTFVVDVNISKHKGYALTDDPTCYSRTELFEQMKRINDCHTCKYACMNGDGLLYCDKFDDTVRGLEEWETCDKRIFNNMKRLVKDKSVSLLDMHFTCRDLSGVYSSCIYSREELIDIMTDHAKNGDTFIAMARDLEENPFTELFLFDESCWGNGCKAIDSKEELMEVLLTGDF